MARPRTDISPRILHAARHRFAKQGVAGSPLRAIARDAGTSLGMIHYYFRSKDELFFAVVEDVYHRLLADLERIITREEPVRSRIEALYLRLGSMNAEEIEVMQMVVREAFYSTERRRRIIERFLSGHVPLIRALAEHGLDDGSFDPRWHPVLVMMAIIALGGVPQAARRLLADGGGFDQVPAGPALAHTLVDILFSGVGVASAAPRRAKESS